MILTGATQPLVQAEPPDSYWARREQAERLSLALDRHVARCMNRESEAERAVKFGTEPGAAPC